MTRIKNHFEFSEDQVVNLDKMKEKAKLTSQEHQNVSVNSVQTKKELAEVESLITQGIYFNVHKKFRNKDTNCIYIVRTLV